MSHEDHHLTDEELMLAADGQVSGLRARRLEAHLAACWACRARRQEMENVIADFVRCRRRSLDPLVPPAAGPRALLKARLAELAAAGRHTNPGGFHIFSWKLALAAALSIAVVIAVASRHPQPPARSAQLLLPDGRLTPGASRPVSREDVCRGGFGRNGLVPPPLERRVFDAYGIRPAEPRAYEVDYLISPDLGGSEDIRNLWPQSYDATLWNARVKDALEDRLHDLVCEGRIDLSTAQREIAANWIEAYKKYFHTETPLEEER
jgi:hypothetical protein